MIKQTKIGIACVVVIVVLGIVSQVSISAAKRAHETDDEIAADEFVDTFVLTPIRTESVGMEVPAAMLGPTTNNACRDWKDKTESCYLPSYCMVHKEQSSFAETTQQLLERHASGVLHAWKVGAWPAGGGNVTYDLNRLQTMEHLWLTTRIKIIESVGQCWLTKEQNPCDLISGAEQQPTAILELEVFDGTHNAQGYPRISND